MPEFHAQTCLLSGVLELKRAPSAHTPVCIPLTSVNHVHCRVKETPNFTVPAYNKLSRQTSKVKVKTTCRATQILTAFLVKNVKITPPLQLSVQNPGAMQKQNKDNNFHLAMK